MKKILAMFAENLLSKQQMKGIKGGIHYCQCPGQTLRPVSDGTDCQTFCGTGGTGENPCETLPGLPGC